MTGRLSRTADNIGSERVSLHEIRCAKCNVALQGPADPQPQDVLSCPRCGESDNLENILREVGDYISEKVGDSFGDMLDRAVKGSEFIKVTHNRPAKRIYRFIADYEPDS